MDDDTTNDKPKCCGSLICWTSKLTIGASARSSPMLSVEDRFQTRKWIGGRAASLRHIKRCEE
jgi:hypothetical protein